ncbi:histidine utilization repressor [Brucella sp. IR073]|uniref:histidine utilization repressor n=1 Tax=unclassified Brucella TaxID=2632610 RepID=UPI003B987919
MSQSRDTTLHQRILAEIEGRIVSGEWQPGYRIPFEVDLAEQYGCSRMTVNKVLTQLAKAGLIERRRKSGSFVKQPQAQSAILEIHDIKVEVQSLKLDYSFSRLKRTPRKANAEDRALLDLPAGAQVLEVVCAHYGGNRRFCLEERLINLGTVPEAASEEFNRIAPGPWLVDRVPWSTAEHKIHAVSASHRVAAILDIPKHTACLVVERRTWSGAGPVTHVRFTYPGDRHALVARFTPASQ